MNGGVQNPALYVLRDTNAYSQIQIVLIKDLNNNC